MLINERTYEDAIVAKTQDRFEASKEILNRWSRIHDMESSAGWVILMDILEKEFKLHDSVFNAKAEELEFKRGYVTGLRFPSQIVKAYKRKAVEAQRYLDSIAKQEKEND